MLEVAKGRSLDAASKHNTPTFSSPGFDQTIAHPQEIDSLQSFNCIAEEARVLKTEQRFGALGREGCENFAISRRIRTPAESKHYLYTKYQEYVYDGFIIQRAEQRV